jgi:DNA repair protein RadC
MKIHEMPLEGRPRERMEKYGVGALSDAELLAIILTKGSNGENVIDMSNRLIKTFGLEKLKNCTLNELQRIKGIGKAKACQVLAVFELNKRVKHSENGNKPIMTPRDVYNYVCERFKGEGKDHFVALYLDTKNKVVKEETVSIGTLNTAVVHPREVFKTAIKENANSMILVHNHPSGDPEPSQEDITTTEKLFKAGELLNIKVLDHVIIGNGRYYSFKNK